MIKAVFFDVANTLLGKEDIYTTIQKILKDEGLSISLEEIKKNHRLITDVYVFPDKTTSEFYKNFNRDFLQSFGIIPSKEIISRMIDDCLKVQWSEFHDVKLFTNAKKLPLGVLSNWDKSLPEKLKKLSTMNFKWILGSEEIGVKKPDLAFFQRMIEISGVKAEEILFVGDSLKLDIIPALEMRINAVLVDRDNHYKHFIGNKITSFNELNKILE